MAKMMFSTITLICLLMGLDLIRSAPVSEQTMYDSIVEKCPQLKTDGNYRNQRLFKTCKDWTRIKTVKKLDLNTQQQQDALCLLYHDSIIFYCHSVESVVNITTISRDRFAQLTISSICNNTSALPDGVRDVIKTKEDCSMVCSDPYNEGPNTLCRLAFYYLQLAYATSKTPVPVGKPELRIVETSSEHKLANNKNMVAAAAVEKPVAQPSPKTPLISQEINQQSMPEAPSAVVVDKQAPVMTGPEPNKPPPPITEIKIEKSQIQNSNALPENNNNNNNDNNNNRDKGQESVVSEPKTLNKSTTTVAVSVPDIAAAPKSDLAIPKKSEKPDSTSKRIEPIVKEKTVEEKLNEEKDPEHGLNESPAISLNNNNNDFGKISENGLDDGDILDNEDNAGQLPPNEPLDQEDDGEDDSPVAKPEKEQPQENALLNTIDRSDAVNYNTEMDGDSYFFSYFMLLCIIFIVGYVCYHNKQKILALLLEGRRGKRQYRSRRPNSANYHKLDSNLEEAISSSCSKTTSNVIY